MDSTEGSISSNQQRMTNALKIAQELGGSYVMVRLDELRNSTMKGCRGTKSDFKGVNIRRKGDHDKDLAKQSLYPQEPYAHMKREV